MLKKERLFTILELVNKKGIITVHEIVEQLHVSTMTVRRDLDELAAANQVVRIHGGAQSIHQLNVIELSNVEKQKIHVSEKKEIAIKVASIIEDNDTVFFGPGTTNEMVADYIDVPYLRVVTNSLPVFNKFKDKHNKYELCLIGGTYREHSGAFIGSLTNEFLQKLRMTKAFVSVNGILDSKVTNANPEEGQTQSIALGQSKECFIVSDHYKIGQEDFYGFYDLNNINAVITDSGIDPEKVAHYEQYTKIIY